MRRIVAIIILLCIAYFICGYVFVYFQFISQDQYFAYAGIVGGLASVAGLFSLIKPTLTKDDLQSLELNSLKSLIETTEQVKALEQKRLQARSEIGDLELRKKEMELLVKKASMSLFLKEQFSQYEQKILSRINIDEFLKESLIQIEEIKVKLDALEEEIESDKNVDTLRNVINSANRRQDTMDELIDTMPSAIKFIFILFREYSKLIKSIIGHF